MSFSLIYVTHEDKESASKLVDVLLQDRLIACGNAFPITSAYWWQGDINHDQEWVSLLKTSHEKWDEVKDRIEQIHPYEVPCIMRISVDANQAYESWIARETK